MSELVEVFGDWMVDAITVETSSGQGAYGQVLAAAVQIPSADHPQGVMVTRATKRIRQSDGNESISTVQILTEPADLGLFTLGTQVTLADGTVTSVEQVNADTHELAGLVVLCV